MRELICHVSLMMVIIGMSYIYIYWGFYQKQYLTFELFITSVHDIRTLLSDEFFYFLIKGVNPSLVNLLSKISAY